YKEDKITDDEFAFNAVYTMACGGMVLSGDDVSELSNKNVELLRKLTPPTDVAAIFDDDTWTIGRAKINENKTVIYVFNFDDNAKNIEISIDGAYNVCDHLNNVYLGTFKDKIILPNFKPHYAVALICTK
ncbi:MAG: hypothetical protein IKA02_05580, partial [Clostridia bacterium]|nr:hypothetical protein [Clostridia bacterium]